MARADSTGARVDATLRVATGPHNQVTGASATPMASTLVLASMFTPAGWLTMLE